MHVQGFNRRDFLTRVAAAGTSLLACGPVVAAFAPRGGWAGSGGPIPDDSGVLAPLAVTPTIRLRPAYLKSGPANIAWQWMSPPPEVIITGNNVKVRVLMANAVTGKPMPGVRCWLDKRRHQSGDPFYPYDSAHTGPDGYAYFLPIYLSPNITWEFRYWADKAESVKRLVRA